MTNPTSPEDYVRYLLLGPVRIETTTTVSISAPKIETLFSALLVRANRPVSTDELVSELWADDPPRRARAALQVYVSQIRKRYLGEGADAAVLHTTSQGYQIDVDPALIDITTAREAYDRGRALAGRDTEAALAEFRWAVAQFRGPALGGLRGGPILDGFTRWADELRLECLESVARDALATGAHRELVGELRRWSGEYPLHEPFREQLMLALFRSGRRAEALVAYRDARQVLRDELGLEPRGSMRRLQQAILTADRDLALAG